MKIYLVRHGESSTTGQENTRPLSKKGKSDVKALAKFIAPLKLKVTYLYHSNKLRAFETAKILLPSIKVENPMLTRIELDPLAPISPLLDEIYAADNDVLLVGHMPFMGKLVSYLVTGKENPDIVAFKAGSMVCLEQKERERWLICWMHAPKQ